ncbi:MAG: DNA polymerase III subunit delta' [Bacteroidales bacterium]|jgi:DNA polymerase-3 subunit delta'|nr:DNA polymerase III subunit delta' [Bacteroidales bacterium]
MNFSQIPGRKDVASKLVQTVKSGRVSHAQIFAGAEGGSGLAFALAYAKYINCEDRREDDACGKCKSCVKYEKMAHPDLHFVFPVVKKKDKDPVSDDFITEWREFAGKTPFFTLNSWLDCIGASNSQGMIYTSEASEIIRKLSLKTFEADYKVMIIWLPEKMNDASANKLLKMIEEPPDKTLFLLVSNQPGKIIATIVSRCQMVRIPRIDDSDAAAWLAKTFGMAEEKAADISHVSNGNMAKAIELCHDEGASLDNLERFKDLMRFAWKRDVLSLINWSETVAALGRELQKEFISYSLRILRENIMLTLGQGNSGIVFMTGAETTFSKNFHPFITENNIFFLADEFSLAYAHVEANGNPKAIFLDLALKVTKVIR